MKLREQTHHLAPYQPVGSSAELFPGTYYLTAVDDKHRRGYERVPLGPVGGAVGKLKTFASLQSPLREMTANGAV